RFFGEQVAGNDGRVWLASVRASLEILGYEVGAADIPAWGFGGPHIRNRLYFVADSKCGAAKTRRHSRAGTPGRTESEAGERERIRQDIGAGSESGILADTESGGRRELREPSPEGRQLDGSSGVGNPAGERLERWQSEPGSLRQADQATER